MLTYSPTFTTTRPELAHHNGQAFTPLDILDRASTAHPAGNLPLHVLRLGDGTEIEATSEEALETSSGNLECTLVVERRHGQYKNLTRVWVLIRDQHGLVDALPFEDAAEALEYTIKEKGHYAVDPEITNANLTEFWSRHNDYERGEDKFDTSNIGLLRSPHIPGIFPYMAWIEWA